MKIGKINQKVKTKIIRQLSKGRESEELLKIVFRIHKRYRVESERLSKKILLDLAKEMDDKGFKLVRLMGENGQGYQGSAPWLIAQTYMQALGINNLSVWDLLKDNKYIDKQYKKLRKLLSKGKQK